LASKPLSCEPGSLIAIGFERTRDALRARKAMGIELGRPKRPGRSKLDKHRDEIIALLKNGSTKAYVARRYKTTTPNLFNWLKKHRIEAKPEIRKIG
jgi:DNA invertase Pin-like site-specific DNA recombinase